MRPLMSSALALLALSSLSAAAQAGPCPPGMVLTCMPQPPDRPPNRPMPCKCDYPPGTTWGGGGGGGGDVHKKNVPSAKANKAPGPND
ncbi:hypothetical protein L6654_40275 [Bradyrhizobium sp. WYCCWR 13023]|uniref:Uncharacterized protein n=1 Tax=Bradyrhizobium zhengyangense TaxID=2911009 RepID=A0A9X1RKL6_9BRAD|nr:MULTISPECIES: hypothetical protein [Bradyrhizobium]MCG2632828.1 hypothetical protein [Bradyrhizobium zhengyangense]MCG2645623.1 hypothetical protein [Bradyrhizobium zhengyangense]MCG2673186.1 hypothetical protein [Bradyrhizobium zhengyangense]